MQLVVYRDRHLPAREVDVCEAAARAVVRVLDDPRSQPGGPWYESVKHWSDGRIRKLVRRADGKRWTDVQELDGVTVIQPGARGYGEARVRAFVPGPVRPLVKALDKLQVSGTHFPPEGLSLATTALAVVEVTPHEDMTSGKLAAQCGHAAQGLYELADAAQRASWRADDFRVEVRHPGAGQWDRSSRQVSIVDAGFTELDGPAETTRASWRASLR
ncbi:hypothetical protein SAMN05443377_10722 [Propionibacterium cyclohexanicum]|uniref:Uncharacterized protein n=1 Tax=Propionibacterium cyclohexanicum TaxID=64702 RepID=A0A1H9RHA2_9ACTN|nr:peptidyl-tRNA hydrolase [Propionibacterium cyclohexanicum]SER71359.1 hypothetical protein SAMN05443377_10722 [Propionibacterium cyclohexanicum]